MAKRRSCPWTPRLAAVALGVVLLASALVVASPDRGTPTLAAMASPIRGSALASAPASTPAAGPDLWQADPTPPGLPGLYYPSLASDPVDGYAVLYGGCTSVECNSWSNETWTDAGGVWTQLNTTVSPGARGEAQMAWDPTLSEVVLFGGVGCRNPPTCTESGTLNDTWTFVHGAWAAYPTTGAVPATEEGGLAFDPSSGNLVLFGGYGCFSGCGTWELVGRAWTEPNLTTAPAEVYGEGLAEDGSDDGVLLFGGVVSSTGSYSDATWLFSKGAWTQISGESPALRVDPTMGWDPTIGSVLLFGGTYVTLSNFPGVTYADTWGFQDGSWTELSSTAPPGARSEAGGAVDPSTGNFVLTGGCGPGGCPYDDVWTYGVAYTLEFFDPGTTCALLDYADGHFTPGTPANLQAGTYGMTITWCAGVTLESVTPSADVAFTPGLASAVNETGELSLHGSGTLTADFVATFPVLWAENGGSCATFRLGGTSYDAGSSASLTNGTYLLVAAACPGASLTGLTVSGSLTFTQSSAAGGNITGNLTVAGAGQVTAQFSVAASAGFGLTDPWFLLAIAAVAIVAVGGAVIVWRRRRARPPTAANPPTGPAEP